MRLFASAEREEIPSILNAAEALTGDYFRLSSFDPAVFPYDVATTAERSAEEEVPEGCFARICKYARDPRPERRDPKLSHFYRILLDDGQILAEAARSSLSLRPLLLYVLTHELVHLVRFVRDRTPFEPYPHRRSEEETLVTRHTHGILKRHRAPGLEAVLGRFALPELPEGR